MKNFKLIVWALLLILFQTVACKYIGIGGIYPNVVFAFIITVCVLEESFVTVAVLPAVCGLIMDCLINSNVGMYTVIFSYSAMLCWIAGERFFKQSLLFAVPLMFVLNTVSSILYMLLHFKIYMDMGFGKIILFVILPSAVYTSAVLLILYPLVKYTVYRAYIRAQQGGVGHG